MEDHVGKQLRDVFGDKTLYEILCVDKTVNNAEIKKAYRKLALKHHPDKGGDEEIFKAISVAHSILSDEEKRKIYDETGTLDDEGGSNQDFEFWYQYFRNLFPKITIKDIEEFGAKYIGSAEEKKDIIDEYIRRKGDMKLMMECIMFAEDGDESRICGIIDAAIENGEIDSLPKYKKTRSVDDPKRKKKKKKTSDEGIDEALVAAMMGQAKSRHSSTMAGIFAKYGDSGTGDFDDEIDDDEFAAIQARISKPKSAAGSKSTTNGKKRSK